MTAFRFNFKVTEVDTKDGNFASGNDCMASGASVSAEQEVTTAEFSDATFTITDRSRPPKEISLTPDIVKGVLQQQYSVKEENLGGINFLHTAVKDADVISAGLEKIFDTHTDLVPDVYEGGLKVWECAADLIQYLHQEKIHFKDQHVLELGCGAGFPGIYALQHGASVVFQDYNEEVIRLLTIPNVIHNTVCNATALQYSTLERDETDVTLAKRGNTSKALESLCDKVAFWSGDWALLEDCWKMTDRFDIILTSETIYATESQPKLLSLMKSLLKPCGTIFLAAKTHYFGVGGGTRQFEQLVKIDRHFKSTVCYRSGEGLQREILMLIR